VREAINEGKEEAKQIKNKTDKKEPAKKREVKAASKNSILSYMDIS
jgi:hypothetical protein